MARATETEHEQRIEQIAQAIIVRAAQRSELIAWAKPRWHINVRQIDYDIAAARARIAQSARVDREFEIGQAVRRLNLVLVLAIKESKLAVALKAQHEINLLLGLAPHDGAIEQFDIATIRKNLAEIATELLQRGGTDELG